MNVEAETERVQLKESKEVVPLSTWVLISNLKVAYTLARQPDGSFNRELAEFLDRKVAPCNVDGVVSMDVVMDRSTGLWSRIFIPTGGANHGNVGGGNGDGAATMPIFFYFHGGSFAHSSANSALYNTVCTHVARHCQVVVISVNYRRSPEHRYPAAYDDCATAVHWLAAQINSGNHTTWLPPTADPSRCFLAGDSNGGNIAHHVAVRWARDRTAGISPATSSLNIVGTILLIPMFGGTRRTPSELRYDGQYFVTIRDRDYYWQSFLPLGADRDHPACNIFGPNSPRLDELPLPPMLLAVAELDMILDWQMEYLSGMRRAGKTIHKLFLREATVGFFIFPNTLHFHLLMDAIKKFIRDPGAASIGEEA
uniref:Putative gibberellin receptor n=1 Tax=Selaginella kraussiana TaxID=81964 RepID=A7U4T3_9TRAC|nr:putative gibberellin receptor [Selaginella kraussiana]